MKHRLALPLTSTTDHAALLRTAAWALAVLGMFAAMGDGNLPLFLVGVAGWGLAGALTFFQGRLLGGLLWSTCYVGGYLLCTTQLSQVGSSINQSPVFVSVLSAWALIAFVAVAVSGLIQSSTRGQWLAWLLIAAVWGIALGVGGYVGVLMGYLLAASLKVGLLMPVALAVAGALAGWTACRVQARVLGG